MYIYSKQACSLFVYILYTQINNGLVCNICNIYIYIYKTFAKISIARLSHPLSEDRQGQGHIYIN